MKIDSWLWLLCASLLSCNAPKQEAAHEVDSTLVVSTEKEIPEILRKELDDIHQTLEANADFQKFSQTTWTRLIRDPQTPSDVYLDHDCNGFTPSFDILTKPDGLYYLRWNYPGGYKEYAVVEFSKNGEHITMFTKEFEGYEYWQAASMNEVTLDTEIQMGPVITWTEGDVSFLFTPEANASNFELKTFGCGDTEVSEEDLYNELTGSNDFQSLEKDWIEVEPSDDSPMGYFIDPECIGNTTLHFVADDDNRQLRMEYQGPQDVIRYTVVNLSQNEAEIIVRYIDMNGEKQNKKFMKLDPKLSSIKEGDQPLRGIYLPLKMKKKIPVKKVNCDE